MPYTSGPAVAALPKRERLGGRQFDRAAADALLALVATDGTTATDGVTYTDPKAARVASNAARRLLAHVAPEGRIPATRHDTSDAGTTWVVFLTDAPTEEQRAARKAATAKAKATREAKAAQAPTPVAEALAIEAASSPVGKGK